VLNTSVTLRLVSSAMSLTLNGVTFEKRFYIAPGTYSVYATAPTGANGTLATMTTVVVNATGHFSRTISLTQLGIPLAGTLVRDTGAPLNASLTLTLTGPSGVALPVEANGGHFVATLPPNATYQVTGNATVLVPVGPSSVYQTIAVDPSYLGCVVGPGPNASCTVPFLASTVETNVTGTLHAAGFSGPVAGTVQLIGPLPSTNSTVADASNGSFQTAVVPGNYTLYATASNGVPYANVSVLIVGPSAHAPVSVTLLSTWTDTVTVTPAPGSGETVATVTIDAPGGTLLSFPNEPVGTGVAFALPAGMYTFGARASGNPFGVPVNATASAVVDLTSGNSATTLALAYQFTTSVEFVTLAPTTATVPAGGTVSFAFTVTNTGNEPRNLSFVGSPAFWNFTFLPKYIHLGVLGANRTVGGEVRIVVPAGTTTLQPSVQLEAVDAVTKAPAGFAQPVPTVSIVPVLGLSLGAATSIGPSVGPYSVSLPFYALNTGNLPESTTFGVADSARLSSIGWTATVEKGSALVSAATTLSPGTNSTFQVVLNSPAHQALPPGSVTVTATVSNLSGGFSRTLVLNVPGVSVVLNNSTAILTGPNVGSPSAYPTWLVPVLAFVPAAALFASAVGYRWFKTRRWTRR
jgi:hypothetical protein